MKFEYVYLIGVGGTGSHLADPLVRLLTYHDQGTRNITIIDGDAYEDKNSERQIFDTQFKGKNKAYATVERLGLSTVKAIADYIDKDKFAKLLRKHSSNEDNFLAIMAVDNAATRHAIITAVDEGDYPNFVLISPGNTFDTGQIVVYARQEGEDLTVHPFAKYKNLKEPEDTIPVVAEGCAAQTPSEPQLIIANMGAAWGTMLIISAMLYDKNWYEEVHFSGPKMKMKPTGAPKCLLLV